MKLNLKSFKGFTLIEILIVCGIFSLLTGIIFSVFNINNKSINNSMKNISFDNRITDFYKNFEIEFNSIVSEKKFFFEKNDGKKTITLECYNPYKYLKYPIIKIKYTFENNIFKKTIYGKVNINSKEIKLFKRTLLKNIYQINMSFFYNNSEIKSYFSNTMINKIKLKFIFDKNRKNTFSFTFKNTY